MAEQAAQIREILAEHKSEPPNILKALLAVQARLGYVPAEAAEEMAQVLGVSAAQLAGVLSYYPDFRLRAAGRHVIRVCQGVVFCQRLRAGSAGIAESFGNPCG
ncbi:MAG: NAD(P)H-dependent oxidoreductase subunit E [Nitrospiraceae bacterium]